MKNIVYLSTAVNLMNDEQLLAILGVARKNNTARNVTGVLLYSEGSFLQVLEGSDEDVDSTLEKILDDPRHKNLIILIDEPIKDKTFADWSMGFASVRASQTAGLTGQLRSLNNLETKGGDSAAITTLKTFIDSNKLPITY